MKVLKYYCMTVLKYESMKVRRQGGAGGGGGGGVGRLIGLVRLGRTRQDHQLNL